MTPKVKALPDELYGGHRYRCIHGLGFRNMHEMHIQLGRQFEGSAELAKRKDYGLFELLALTAGKTPEEYARLHSMLPLIRMSSIREQMASHGSPESSGCTRRWASVQQTDDARFCIACAESERVPYWHRCHQILGVDWCHIHGTPLYTVRVPPGENAYEYTPLQWLAADCSAPTSGPQFMSDERVNRYAQISFELLKQSKPAHCGTLRRLIMRRAKVLAAREDLDGPTWLNAQLMSLDVAWRPGPVEALISKQAHILRRRNYALPGCATAMLLALTAATAQDALDWVQEAQEPDFPSATRSPAELVGDDFWHGEFWAHYLNAEGSVAALKRATGLQRATLYKRITDVGLASLTGLNTRPIWDALLEFRDGRSVEGACQRAGVQQDDLENLLRSCAARLATAVRRVRLERGSKAKGDQESG